MTHALPITTEMLVSPDGIGLFRSSIVPERPRAHVLLIHGYADHQGRYEVLRRELADAGLASHMVDLRGHGRSGGARGHVVRFGDYLTDLHVLRQHVEQERQGLPLFLAGHSMGGLIALQEAIEQPVGLAGVVVSGPMLGLAIPVPPWKKALGRAVSALWPGFAMSNGIEPWMLSRDPSQRASFDTDPLRHRLATARWFTEAEAAMASTAAHAGRLTLPSLILCGGDDPILDLRAVRRFSEQVPRPDHQLVCYDGLLHEIWLESPPGGEQARKKLVTWIDERLSVSSCSTGANGSPGGESGAPSASAVDNGPRAAGAGMGDG